MAPFAVHNKGPWRVCENESVKSDTWPHSWCKHLGISKTCTTYSSICLVLSNNKLLKLSLTGTMFFIKTKQLALCCLLLVPMRTLLSLSGHSTILFGDFRSWIFWMLWVCHASSKSKLQWLPLKLRFRCHQGHVSPLKMSLVSHVKLHHTGCHVGPVEVFLQQPAQLQNLRWGGVNLLPSPSKIRNWHSKSNTFISVWTLGDYNLPLHTSP